MTPDQARSATDTVLTECERLLTVAMVARRLRKHENTVRWYLLTGRLPYIRRPRRNAGKKQLAWLLVPESAVMDFQTRVRACWVCTPPTSVREADTKKHHN